MGAFLAMSPLLGRWAASFITAQVAVFASDGVVPPAWLFRQRLEGAPGLHAGTMPVISRASSCRTQTPSRGWSRGSGSPRLGKVPTLRSRPLAGTRQRPSPRPFLDRSNHRSYNKAA